ncbi:MAG TPA: endolytic transglycosylase MltG [Desulfovibrio sp.]|nr:endolytic transglycosylase MltG [Desulfovibrio sp.]
MLRILLRALAALALLGLLAGGYAGYDAWRFLRTPPASPGADVYVDVEPGATFDRVTKQLVDKGAVTSDWRFKLLAHHHGWETSLKAGRFLVHSGWTPFRVLDQLVNGQPVLSRITLREGLTWWETARLLEAEGFVTVEDFRAVITDPAFLRHWGIPFDTAEGFLFPDTYLIKKPPVPDRESARAVAGRLVDTFWRRAAQVWPDGRPARDELRRLITLASIVEKETGLPAERGRVAGVYANRLRTGMLLQADPTTIYGLGETFDGNLRRPHLQDAANPYNTYRRPGLPPGPVCSPGMESLRAATTPEKHGYFYFVSRNDGSHQFSATLDEHNRAVNRFQRAGRAKGAAQGTPTDAATPAPQAGATAAQDERPATATDADAGGNAAAVKAPAAPVPPAAPAADAKAAAPDKGDKEGVRDKGAKAGTGGASGMGDAPATPDAQAPTAQPQDGQPAPAEQAAPTSGTEAPATTPLPAKTSPGSKPAAEPVPRKAKNSGSKAEDATPAANTGVRAPTAPRETAQPGDGATSGAAPGQTGGTSGGMTGGTPETQGTPKAIPIPGPPAPTATPALPAAPVAPAPTSPETPPATAAPPPAAP